MAAVLDALAPYVKKLIAEMAQEEISMLLGVPGEITKLEDNMENIKAFVADAERRRLTDQSVQRWVRKLKDAMYDATDILDLCQLEADKHRDSREGGAKEKVPLKEKVPGCFHTLLFCLRNPVFVHEIGSRIKELNQRLEEIYKGAANFNFITNFSSYQDLRRLPEAESSGLKTMSEFDETAIVGENIERDTKELAQVLITNNEKQDLKVVSIVGMGGMGKTTLAQKIFNEATIQKHFKTRIWLSITQHFDEAELLRTAISHSGGQHGGEQDKSKLVENLTNTLSASKFLLVMDDVWVENSWNHVLSVPTRNASRKQQGSRVVVTTRFEDLARKMQLSLHQHHVGPLGEEDAWSLLKKQLPRDQVEIDHLKSIGIGILKRCDGLPLAIKVIGGLLSTKYPSESEWKAVLNNPAWSVDGLPQELDKRLYLSYEDLAPQLKQCFLYCTLFPKGTSIPQTLVTGMWISEGFVQPPERSGSPHEDRLEYKATEYYRDLIKRNLIQPAKGFDLTGWMCTLHDVVRSFAEYMAREEMLVVRDEQDAADSGLFRRLSIAPTAVRVLDWASPKKQKSLRTLAIFSNIKLIYGDSMSCFSSLRVLYLVGTDSHVLVDSLCHLKHLRFLHLCGSNISSLPDDIHKMKFLRSIFLFDCKKLAHLPSSIVKLAHLRHLDITRSNIRAVPKGFGGLTNVRLLCGFPVHVEMDGDSWCSLQELAPLSQLRELTLDGVDKVPASWMAEKAMLRSKGHLSNLTLEYSASIQQEQQQRVIQEEVLESLWPPASIETLLIEGGYLGGQFPSWMRAPASADLKSLRYVGLENLPCCTQLPDGLCHLPCLEVLSIQHAPAVRRIGPEFQASHLAPGHSAAMQAPFPKLRALQLLGLSGWEEWEWNCCKEQGDVKGTIGMPCLEKLLIDNCKLSHLPPGLANSTRHDLRRLHLHRLAKLVSVENFPSVVELKVIYCARLKRISGLSKLHKITISNCPALEVLHGVEKLDSVVLRNSTMETLPGYLEAVNPRYLELKCSKTLYESLSQGSSECNRISHIGRRDISHY